MTEQNTLPWQASGWLAEVEGWVDGELARVGKARTGALEELRATSWSTVLRVPMRDDQLFFKAVAPVLGYEVPLTAALAVWRPADVVHPLAADIQRRWLLLEDGGVTLRSQISSAAELGRWDGLLPRFAELQIELAQRQQDLLRFGVPDRRPAVLPELLLGLIATPEAAGLSAEERAGLEELLPQIRGLCAELEGGPIPSSLNHEDFHDANILVRDGHARFVDWGDVGISHPFSTLLVTLRSIAYRLELDEHGPDFERLRLAYLEPWERFAPRAELLELAERAWLAGMICRALTWRTVAAPLPAGPERTDCEESVVGWLQYFRESLMARV